jgi:hypothetical protein
MRMIYLLFIISLFVACSDQVTNSPSQKEQNEHILSNEELKTAIMELFGVSSDDISETDNAFFLDDIRFQKGRYSSLFTRGESPKGPSLAKTGVNQSTWNDVALPYYQLPAERDLGGHLCYYMDPSMNAIDKSAFYSAIWEYNKLSHEGIAGITLHEVPVSTLECFRVKTFSKFDSYAVLGQCNGNPGCADYPHPRHGTGKHRLYLNIQQSLRIEQEWWNDSPFEDRKNLAMHELGHILGLGHAGDYLEGQTQIPGTNESSESIMYKYVQGAVEFTQSDKIALAYLWPYNTVPYIKQYKDPVDNLSKQNLIGVGQILLLQDVVSFKLQEHRNSDNPYRLAALQQSTGDILYVKEGNQGGAWVNVHGGVKQYQIEGKRIAIITHDNTLRIKEGSLSAEWRNLSQTKKVILSGNRVGALRNNGDLYVKEGALTNAWHEQAKGVKDFDIDGDRIAIVTTGGSIKVKKGELWASWFPAAQPANPTPANSFAEVRLEGDNTLGTTPQWWPNGLWAKTDYSSSPYFGLESNIVQYDIFGSDLVIVKSDGALKGKSGLENIWTDLATNGKEIRFSRNTSKGKQIHVVFEGGVLGSKFGMHGNWKLEAWNAITNGNALNQHQHRNKVGIR